MLLKIQSSRKKNKKGNGKKRSKAKRKPHFISMEFSRIIVNNTWFNLLGDC